MKKLTVMALVSTLIFASSTVQAIDRCPFDGFYLGASIGGTSTNVTQHQDNLATIDTDDPFSFSLSGPNSLKTNNSFKGALFAGLGGTWHTLYLGAEIFADLGKYKNHQYTSNTFIEDTDVQGTIDTTTRTRVNSFQFGIDLRPGFLVTANSLLYGRVGVAYARPKLDVTTTINVIDSENDEIVALAAVGSKDKHFGALRLGAGLEQHICRGLNLRLDYIFTYYGKQDLAAYNNFTIAGGEEDSFYTLNNNTSVRIKNNTAMLGLSYNFS